MAKYVCGFLFDPTKKYVVLIEKQKPDWQKGLLNGVGGAIEENEKALQAMVREFEEETGLHISSWKGFLRLIDRAWDVTFFKAISVSYNEVRSTTIEQVKIIETAQLFRFKCIPNLRWLIPLAMDPNHSDGILHTKKVFVNDNRT